MNRYKIELVTMKDVQSFIDKATSLEGEVYLEDNSGMRINAKSILGVIYTFEWNELYVLTTENAYDTFAEFII